MGRRIWIPICLALLCGRFGAAEAQTVYGPGGLFVHPTAFTPPRGDVDLNVSYFTQTIASGAGTDWLPVSLTVGVTDRAEVGALYLNRRVGGGRRDSAGLFAKYELVTDQGNRPAFALVGSYLSGDVKQSSVSGVLSHRFLRGDRTLLIAHLGLQWAQRADIPVTSDGVSAYLGLEIPLTPRIKLLGEEGTRFGFDLNNASAVGVVWSVHRDIQIGVGFVNAGRSRDDEFFVGVGYLLGGKK